MKKILLLSFLAFSLGLFGQTYCGPLHFGYIDPDDPFWDEDGDEPITLVNFAGINNTTDDVEYVGTYHQMFLSQTANVARGNSYTITMEGNTAGNFTNLFVVFIDWNQNGILNDAGEVYEVTQSLTNSTGIDGQQVTHSIAVPSTANLGNTRMRVKKLYDDDTFINDLTNPCVGGEYGQAEDYTVNVTSSLSTLEVTSKNKIGVYPNPVSDVLNIEANEKIERFDISDLTGKTVLSDEANSNKVEINVSHLSTGNYLLKVKTASGTSTQKIIKK